MEEGVITPGRMRISTASDDEKFYSHASIGNLKIMYSTGF